MPHTLPELVKGLDMDSKRKAMIAEAAVADPSTGTNPVKLTKKAALEILQNSIDGKL